MTESDRSPLHWAASEGDDVKVSQILEQRVTWIQWMREDIVRKLIQSGANVNWTNENGSTSLLYAASRDRMGIAKLFIDSGADVNKRDRMGSTALHRAASRGHLSMVQVLVSVTGIEVNAYDNEKNTPLHLACEEERGDVCRVLIKAGASLSLENKEKKTPLDMCKSAGFRRSLLVSETRSA